LNDAETKPSPADPRTPPRDVAGEREGDRPKDKPAVPQSGKVLAEAELPELITIGQAASLVNRSARTLEWYKSTGMPTSLVLGGGG
jgi:hypothetical protein